MGCFVGGIVLWMFTLIPEFWEDTAALGVISAAFCVGLVAFVASIVAAFTHKKCSWGTSYSTWFRNVSLSLPS